MTSAILRATPTDALSHGLIDLIDLIDPIADNTAAAVWFLQWVEQFRALDAAFTAHRPHDPPPPRDGGGPGLSGTDATMNGSICRFRRRRRPTPRSSRGCISPPSATRSSR